MCKAETNVYLGKRFTARTLIDKSRNNDTYRVRLLLTDLWCVPHAPAYTTVIDPLSVGTVDGVELVWFCNEAPGTAIRISGLRLPKMSSPEIAHVLTWYPLYSQDEADIIAQRILHSLKAWDEHQSTTSP